MAILTINGRTITITSQSDGIKVEPDSNDEKEQLKFGRVINVNSKNDTIQSEYKLIIKGGTF